MNHLQTKNDSAVGSGNKSAMHGNRASRTESGANLVNPLWQGLSTGMIQPNPVEGLVQRMCTSCENEQKNQLPETVVQPKLTVGAADDEYEREADSVADTVMRMQAASFPQEEEEKPVQTKLRSTSPVQRLCAECEQDEEIAVQRKFESGAGANQPSTSVQQAVSSPGPGAPLPEAVRGQVEPVLGADLSDVRVHSSTGSRQAAKDINAMAFTHKNNIHLGEGQSSSNVALMAHELTHVVQQGAVPSAPAIQRRIVMRTITPEERNFPLLGTVQVGTRENLRAVTNEEVEEYINDIGTVHHDYDDIVNGTGEEFDFVSSRSYRRELIDSIIRSLHRVRTDLYFDSYQEVVQEVRKRALISLFMRASQGRTYGSRPTGYPRSCGDDPGPRVSQAAEAYWIVHPSTSADHYWFELSNDGKSHAYEALRTLIFNHQNSACLRTLMHCDYMVSAQQFFVMAHAMGRTDFNRAVFEGDINLEIRWNSYENIVADSSTSSGQYQSLQMVELNSEDEFIVGDHVIFFNHDAFDDMNQVYANVHGNFSNWRLENAIISDMSSTGDFRFQGHGYFRPKFRAAFVNAMVGKMNDLVDAARSAISSGDTNSLGFSYNDGSRFEVVRSDGQNWNIHYHEGLGEDANLPVLSMPLRRFSAADYPNPFAAPGETKIRVRRPIESRRESIGTPQSSAPGATSPLPMPGRVPVPSRPSPVPTPEAPVPIPAPNPAAPGPLPGSVTGSQPSESQQQQTGSQQTVPSTRAVSPCPFICPKRHFLGERTPHYGRGDDFNYYDFPSLSTWEWVKVAPFRLMPDSLLEFGMNNVLGLLAGSDGRAMVSHFRGGTGATWTHGVGSNLNRDATHCSSVDNAVRNVQTQLAAQMRTMRALRKIDCRAFSLSPVPSFHFGFGDSAALKAIIGGTQGLEVYLDAMRLKDPSTCSYELDLQLVVLDDFGVDKSDLYWPALIKFWILQHERRGNRPFINKLLINRTIVV